MKNKIGFTLLFALLLNSALVMANGAQESKQSGPDDQITLTVWDFKYSEEVTGSAFKDMDSLFMAKYPNVTIKHIAQPMDNYYELLSVAMASGTGPDIMMGHPDERVYVMEEFLLNMDPYIADWKSDISDSAWAASSVTGDIDKNIKLVPLTAQGMGVYINKSNLVKAGIDADADLSDWDAFLAACQKLKDSGIPPIIMGNAGAPYSVDFAYRVLLTNFYGDDLKGFSNGEANFTDEAFIEATVMLKQLFTLGYINTENETMPYFMDAIETFKSGEGAFFFGLTSDIAHWKDFGEAFGYDSLGYLPSFNSENAPYKNRQSNQGAGLGFGVSKFSKHIDAAMNYLYEYTHGESASLFLNRTGAIVPNKNLVLENDALTEIVGYMNTNGVPDFNVQLDLSVATDLSNYIQLFFIIDDITLNEFIEKLQESYENNL